MIKDNTQLTMEDLKGLFLNEEITAEQFFLIECLKTDKEYLKHYLDVNKHHVDTNDLVQDLVIKGYITLLDTSSDYTIDNLSIKKNICDKEVVVDIKPVDDTFETRWNEFISLYPKKSGDRPLHNTKSACREKYFRYLQTGTDHSEVMKGLKLEIELREIHKRKKKFFPEWKLLSTYINQKGWEQFLDLDEVNENQEFNVTDGRITRVL